MEAWIVVPGRSPSPSLTVFAFFLQIKKIGLLELLFFRVCQVGARSVDHFVQAIVDENKLFWRIFHPALADRVPIDFFPGWRFGTIVDV